MQIFIDNFCFLSYNFFCLSGASDGTVCVLSSGEDRALRGNVSVFFCVEGGG